jgi:hypothetical protein
MQWPNERTKGGKNAHETFSHLKRKGIGGDKLDHISLAGK